MKRRIVPLAVLSSFVLISSIRSSPNSQNGPQADAAPRSKWTTTEIPVHVLHLDTPHWALASAQGYWQSTSSDADKQLVNPIAVKIKCDRSEKICREVDASVDFGILEPELVEYDISTWTDSGILADDIGEGKCGIAHLLSIDFKGNNVTVTDYPTKVSTDNDCKAFQDAASYALHGGQLMLYPPAPWNPLEKKK